MADMSGERAPEQYEFKNKIAANFLINEEGNIDFQTNVSKTFDPETKEFIAYGDEIKNPDGSIKSVIPTIGYGITPNSESKFNVKVGQRIPVNIANMSLDQEIDARAKRLKKLKIPDKYLNNEKTKAAILSLDFNLGIDGTNALKALKEGNIEKFKFYAFHPSKEAGNTYLLNSKGLRDRRQRELNLFEEGLSEIKKAGGGIVMNDPDKNYNTQRFI